MLQSEIFTHLLVTLVYFFVLTLFHQQFNLSWTWFWVGGILGTFLLDIDHFFYWFFVRPEEGESRQARVLLKTNNLRGLYFLLQRNHIDHIHLVFHTATFQVILLALTFYVLTSGGSFLGSGMVLALNLHLLKDEWFDFFRRGKAAVSEWLFWQIGGSQLAEYSVYYLSVVSLIVLIFTLVFI